MKTEVIREACQLGARPSAGTRVRRATLISVYSTEILYLRRDRKIFRNIHRGEMGRSLVTEGRMAALRPIGDK